VDDILEKALDYARHGWPVFPILPRGKRPLTEHGFKDAATDEPQVRDWWHRWPDANVGLPTGAAVGFWVLDVDGAEGARTIAQLQEHHGTLEAPCARTGSGGLHYLFQHDPRIRNTVRFAPGLDTRADGGYIVAPPSVHENGKRYRWERGGNPVPAPDWLLEKIIRPERKAPTPIHAEAVVEGSRNAYLTSIAGKLRRIGLTDQTLLAAIEAENARICRPPLPDREVEGIANSILRYAPASNTTVPANVQAPTIKTWTAPEFVAHEWPPRYDLLRPWLKESSLTMLHAARGTGKSWIAMTIGLAVAGGFDGKAFGWSIPEPREVLYVDAEMVPVDTADRLRKLCEPDYLPHLFRILSAGAGDGPLPSLSTPEGRLLVEDCIGDASFLVLDNVSTLWSGTEDQNAAESWSIAQEWLLSLRCRGLAVMVIDHAGKTTGRGPRGTSRKEDIMDVCIELSRPEDAADEDGARFVWRFTKSRGLYGEAVRPMDIRLRATFPHFTWAVEAPDAQLRDDVLAGVATGKSLRQLEKELGISKSRIHRYVKLADVPAVETK
jgi:hypothetical protein